MNYYTAIYVKINYLQVYLYKTVFWGLLLFNKTD